MATTKILLKKSSTPGGIPDSSDLEYGELAINYADGKLYYKDDSNQIKSFLDSDNVNSKYLRSDKDDRTSGTLVVDGYLGIGTPSPASNLHINGPGVVNAQITSTGNNANLLIQADDGYFSRLWFGDTTAYDVGSIVYNHFTNSLAFTVNSINAMTIDSAGNIAISGTLDGRDIAADGATLDAIVTTSTTNVQAAGAVMDFELTDSDAVKSLNQGVSTTDTPTFGNTTISGTVPRINFSETDIGNSHRIIASAGDLYIQAQDSDGTNDGILYLTGYNATPAKEIIHNSSLHEFRNGSIRLISDNQEIQFGASQDYTIDWDGADASHTIASGRYNFAGPTGLELRLVPGANGVSDQSFFQTNRGRFGYNGSSVIISDQGTGGISTNKAISFYTHYATEFLIDENYVEVMTELRLDDNVPISLGTSQDAQISFDGTNLEFSTGFNVNGGLVRFGVNDTTRGQIYLYGGTTGQAGGEILIFTGADYDTNNNYWQISPVTGEDLQFKDASGTTWMSLDHSTGNVVVSNDIEIGGAVDAMYGTADGTTKDDFIGGYASNDRAFRMMSERQGGSRYYWTTFNLDYDGTTFTQGNWGGSSAIKYDGQYIRFYSDTQVTAGSTDSITPTEILEINDTGLDLTGNLTISGTVDGRDIAADGSKLDGIEAGATADQTDSEILAAIKNVDGSGSGLDADTVDGIEGSEIWRKGADIPGGADLNDYTTDGYYHQNSNANAASGSNYPVDLAGMLEVTSDGNMVYQRYTVYNSTHDVYVRTKYISTWYSWAKQWTSINHGPGSLLNADLLDGLEATDFVRINTTSGNSNDYLHVARNSTGATLYVNNYSTGDIARFYKGATSGATSGTDQVTITNSGGITATGTIKIDTGHVALSFENRAALVTYWSDGKLPNGTIVSDGTSDYVAVSGSTQISDLGGLEYYGRPTPYHFGAAGDGVTDDTSAIQEWADELRTNGGYGLLPAASFLITSEINFHPTADFVVEGVHKNASEILVDISSRSSVGLNFTNSTPSTRNTGGYRLSNFAIVAEATNKACLMEHENASNFNWTNLRLINYTGTTSIRAHQVYNSEINDIVVWGAGHNVPYKNVGSTTFSITSGATTLTSSAAIFAAGDVGRKITLFSGGIGQTFEISSYSSTTSVQVTSAAQTTYSAAVGSFGGVRGTTTASSTTLTLESNVLTSDDIGRVVYIIGAGPTIVGSTIPLRTTITNVSGTTITLADAATESVTNADIIFDPAVDFGNSNNSYSDYTNDFSVEDLMIEQFRGTGLVASGITFRLDRLKVHGVGITGIDDEASNIPALFSYFQGYVSGTFEQYYSGNLGRIVIAGGNGGWTPDFLNIEVLPQFGTPIFYGANSGSGTSGIGNVKTIGNAIIDFNAELYDTDGSGFEFVRTGLITQYGASYWESPAYNDTLWTDHGNSRVGVNTRFPQSDFDVRTTSGSVNAQLTSTTSHANFLIQAADGFSSRLWLGDNTDYDIGAIEYDHSTNAMIFKTNNAEVARFSSAGAFNVDGTITLDNTLTVDGSVPTLVLNDTDGTNQYTNIVNGGGGTYIRSRNNTVGGSTIFQHWNGTGWEDVVRFSIDKKAAIGIDDTDRGIVAIYGNGAGNTYGGELRLHMAADYDSTYDYWRLEARNDDFRIGAGASTNYLTILDGGNVGIGTTVPYDKLEVAGGIRTTSGYVRAGDWDGDGVRLIAGRYSGTAPYFAVSTINSSTAMQIGVGNNFDLKFSGGGDIYFENTGNVGIGTSTPSAPLHVAGDVQIDSNLTVAGGIATFGVSDNTQGIVQIHGDGTGSTSGGELRIFAAADHDTTVNYWRLFMDGDTFKINATGIGDGVRFNTSQEATFPQTATFNKGLVVDTNTLVVDDTNNRVGIGTASPAFDLDVNGSGHFAEGIRPGAVSGEYNYIGRGDTYDFGTPTNTSANDLLLTGGLSNNIVIGSKGNNNYEGILLGGLSTGASPVFSEVMRVDTVNDRVGIGTASPGVQLDQLGDALMHRVRSTTSTNAYARYQGTTGIMAVGVVGGTGYVGTNDTTDLRFLVNSVELMRLDQSSGRIGVGTSSPETTFDIQSSTAAAGVQIKSTVGNASIFLNSDSSALSRIYFGHGNDFDEALIQYSPFGNSMTFFTNARGSADMTINNGNVTIAGALSKGSGSFRIKHPLKPDTHDLVHSFIEGPTADNIYRGKVTLQNGTATVDLDEVSNMTSGTFVALNRNIQCFTSNEDGWTQVRGKVIGSILHIESKDPCDDEISWMVIGERQDAEIYASSLTDENGHIIVEVERKLNQRDKNG